MQIGLNLPVVNPEATPAFCARWPNEPRKLASPSCTWVSTSYCSMTRRTRTGSPTTAPRSSPRWRTCPTPSSRSPISRRAPSASVSRPVSRLLPQRNPVYTAKHVATLDWLSGGRASTSASAWAGAPRSTRRATCRSNGVGDRCPQQYVAVLRTLWCDPISSFSGEFYELAVSAAPEAGAASAPTALVQLRRGHLSPGRRSRFGVLRLRPDPSGNPAGSGADASFVDAAGRSMDEITISHGVYNRLPVRRRVGRVPRAGGGSVRGLACRPDRRRHASAARMVRPQVRGTLLTTVQHAVVVSLRPASSGRCARPASCR